MTDDMSIYQTATKTKPRKIPDAIASNQGLILAKKIQSDRRVACGVWICGGRNLNAEKLSRKGKVDKSYSEPFFFLFFFRADIRRVARRVQGRFYRIIQTIKR